MSTLSGLPIARLRVDGTIEQGVIARCAIGALHPMSYTGVVWADGAVTPLHPRIEALYAVAYCDAAGEIAA